MTPTPSLPEQAAAAIKAIAPHCHPKIGLILGSGLGDITHLIEQPIIIPYDQLPGFPVSQVPGHCNQLWLGTINNQPVACLQGRTHYYETGDFTYHKTLIRTLKCLGCEILIATCSAGSLDATIPCGSLLLVKDHINLQGRNPLVGPNDDNFGPRFVGMDAAYDAPLRTLFLQSASELALPLASGIYLAVSGPTFETPAEIAAFRHLGATAIGMSTVPDVIIARHCGLRVVVLAAITNLAAGLDAEPLSHHKTLQGALSAVGSMATLIGCALGKLN